MRMRRMRNLEPRMEKCAAYRIAEPAARKGAWRELMPGAKALWVELGCGKGKFTAETAQANPDVLLIAVERCREAMVVAMEKARDLGLNNVFYIDMDVAGIEDIFAPGEIDRLFINFPDPWPRKKNAKRRLTHRAFLDKYCRVVREGGELHFKATKKSSTPWAPPSTGAKWCADPSICLRSRPRHPRRRRRNHERPHPLPHGQLRRSRDRRRTCGN